MPWVRAIGLEEANRRRIRSRQPSTAPFRATRCIIDEQIAGRNESLQG